MKNYIVLNNKTIIELLGVTTVSTGDGLEVTQRYGYDYSKKPQSLVYRRRNTALTATIQTAFNALMCADAGKDIYDYISDIEDITGQKVDIYINGKPFGSFVITSIQFSLSCDTISVIQSAAVSISLVEGYIARETLYTKVKTF